MTIPVITIDGPSGSGKGTVARSVANVLGWHLLDSGALYRLTALAAIQRDIAFEEADLAAVARSLSVTFSNSEDGNELILLNNHDVTADIRTEVCGENASRAAVFPAVRAALVERQRAFAEPPGLVADGRDMGTEIFPDAGLKVFLTASAEARADRRHKQLKENNIDVNLAALLKDIQQRDERDASRAVAPLVPASDAVQLDSTSMDAAAVIAKVLEMKNQRFGVG
ncbi:MAG: (d)CMP kinase [Woeseiaceae bacterium]